MTACYKQQLLWMTLDSFLPSIEIKLNRVHLPGDLVSRPVLLEKLSRGRRRSSTAVSLTGLVLISRPTLLYDVRSPEQLAERLKQE